MTFYRKRLFPVLAGLLWLTFLTLDLTGWGDSTWVKFAAICLCCATALTGMKTTDGKLVALALCLTVGADWFLLVRKGAFKTDQMLGIGLFIVVQLLYARRLSLWWGGKRPRWARILRRLSLLSLLPVLLSLLMLLSIFFAIISGGIGLRWGTTARPSPSLPFDPYTLVVLSPPLFYFLTLCLNAVEAYVLSHPLKERWHDEAAAGKVRPIFAVGLILFICCDICVGLWNLYPPPPRLLREFAQVGMWFFYLPSQVLIVLSQELEKGDLDEKRF